MEGRKHSAKQGNKEDVKPTDRPTIALVDQQSTSDVPTAQPISCNDYSCDDNRGCYSDDHYDIYHVKHLFDCCNCRIAVCGCGCGYGSYRGHNYGCNGNGNGNDNDNPMVDNPRQFNNQRDGINSMEDRICYNRRNLRAWLLEGTNGNGNGNGDSDGRIRVQSIRDWLADHDLEDTFNDDVLDWLRDHHNDDNNVRVQGLRDWLRTYDVDGSIDCFSLQDDARMSGYRMNSLPCCNMAQCYSCRCEGEGEGGYGGGWNNACGYGGYGGYGGHNYDFSSCRRRCCCDHEECSPPVPKITLSYS